MLLMIDNYDSFTFNLVQYFGELGQEVKVVRNDEITVAEIAALQPRQLVLSPATAEDGEEFNQDKWGKHSVNPLFGSGEQKLLDT